MNNVATVQHAKALEILGKPYVRRLQPDEEGRGFTATISEFPGCIAEGDTADEALQNLERVAASWLEVSLAHGRQVRDPASFEGCSGKIALRIPRGLHRQVAELAEEEDCSINQLLTTAIAHYVSGKKVANFVTKALESVCLPSQNVRIEALYVDWGRYPTSNAVKTLIADASQPLPLHSAARPARLLNSHVGELRIISEKVHG